MDCKADGPGPVPGLLQAWNHSIIFVNDLVDTKFAELANTLENENRIQCDLGRMRKRDKITNCMSAEINVNVNKQIIVLLSK